jgi:hypothetical protein
VRGNSAGGIASAIASGIASAIASGMILAIRKYELI